MRKKTGIIIALFFFISLPIFALDDAERLKILKATPDQEWKRVEQGTKAWPEELFPLSTWTDKELAKMPPEFWAKVRKAEKEWPLYIQRLGDLYEKEFGPGIKNGYDLFLLEQAQMRDPKYFEASDPIKIKKTLKRLGDVAYLPGKNFNFTETSQIESVRLYAYSQGKLRPIPFDIVEFSKEGQVVLTSGPEANSKDGDGIFNGGDLLFFMVADAGHKLDKSYVKNQLPGSTGVYEIEISYSKEYERGWVYLTTFSGRAPARSPIDYTKFYPEVGISFSPFTYAQCECRKVGSKTVPTGNIQTMLGSPSMGAVPIDVHNSISISLVAIPAVGKKIEHNESEFDLSFRAWYEGNVIDYRRATWKIKYTLGAGSSTTVTDAVITPFFAFNCSAWYNSPYPEWAVKYIEMSFGEDMNKRVLLNNDILKSTAKFISSADREGVIIDGVMSEKEKKWDKSLKSWYLLTGIPGTILMKSGCDPATAKNATLGFDWQDDMEHLGFSKHIMILRDKTRTGYFYMEWAAVPRFWTPTKFRWENLDLVLKRTDKPLTYRIDDGSDIVPGKCIHIPDIMKVKKKYRYN
jgi:hypothetical protein